MDTSNSDYWSGNSQGRDPQSCMPNCTCYARGRCLEIGSTEYINWKQYNYYDPAQIKPGDVIGDYQHVGFVERVDNQGTANAVVYTSNSWYTNETGRAGNTQRTAGTGAYPISSLTLDGVSSWAQSHDAAYGAPAGQWASAANRIFRYSSNWGEASGHGSSAVPDRFWSNPNNPQPEPPGPEPDPGGGGYWIFDHTDSMSVGKTLVEDQTNPYIPPASNYISVSEEIRNPRWASIQCYTDERQIHYNQKSVGYWADDWVEIYSSDYDFNTTWGD